MLGHQGLLLVLLLAQLDTMQLLDVKMHQLVPMAQLVLGGGATKG